MIKGFMSHNGFWILLLILNVEVATKRKLLNEMFGLFSSALRKVWKDWREIIAQRLEMEKLLQKFPGLFQSFSFCINQNVFYRQWRENIFLHLTNDIFQAQKKAKTQTLSLSNRRSIKTLTTVYN